MPLRALIGIAAAFALLLAAAAQAEPVRIPKEGDPAFAFDAPPGWKVVYEAHGNLQFMRGRVFLQLGIAAGPTLTGQTLDVLATLILTAAGMPPFTHHVIGSIAGRPGQIYFVTKSQNGVAVELSLTLVRLDDTHVATLTRISQAGASIDDLSNLEDLASKVRFVGVR